MTHLEQRRLLTWRWRMLQQVKAGGSVAHTCRHFGVSRKTFYKWKKRYIDGGEAALCDRVRIPHRSPRATSPRSDLLPMWSVRTQKLLDSFFNVARICAAGLAYIPASQTLQVSGPTLIRQTPVGSDRSRDRLSQREPDR